MTQVDLFLGPVYFLLFMLLGFMVRSFLADKASRKYFLPGLAARLFGAIAFGLVYQFYYGSGDTFYYFSEISRLNKLFSADFNEWWSVVIDNDADAIINYSINYRSNYAHAPREFSVAKFGSLISGFTTSTYVTLSMGYAFFSYIGCWLIFNVALDLYPTLIKYFNWAILLSPSVVFWGSGLMKDSLCMGGLGIMFYGFYYGSVSPKGSSFNLIFMIIGAYLILSLKPYIVYAFAPAAALWWFNQRIDFMKSNSLKLVLRTSLYLTVLLAAVGISVGLFGGVQAFLDDIARGSKVTAEWILYSSGRDDGSGYSLGELDGTFSGMLAKFLPAVNVTLYRPYLWEARNIVMIIAALESTFYLLFSLYILFKTGVLQSFRNILKNPFINFALQFSVAFAFFIGVSTYNFGSLVRYKIPMLPFFLSALIVLLNLRIVELREKRIAKLKRVVHFQQMQLIEKAQAAEATN